MSQLKYPDPVTPRAGFDPTLPRPVDPDVQRAEVRGDAALAINRYFVEHPEMALGDHARTSSTSARRF